MKPTVYAVMKATVEIPVRPSDCNETFDQMFSAAQREAEDKLRSVLKDVRIVGPVEFSYAVVRSRES